MEENEMNYEQKYNEALEAAQQIYKDMQSGGNYGGMEDLEVIFPELAESEDEKMCKRCIDLLRKVSAYSGEEYLGVEIADCIIGLQALRKKQKETLHISETCKENADSFTDEDERIRRTLVEYFGPQVQLDFVRGVPIQKIRDWLEKQKEHQFYSDAPKEKSVGGDFLSSHKDKDLDEIAQDYVNGVKECNLEPTWDLMQTAVCYGYHLAEQKEQKPTSPEDMPYITDEHFFEREPKDSFKYKLAEYMTKCCTKKEGLYGYEYGISAETILKMAEEELLKRGVVNKPAEWKPQPESLEALMYAVEGKWEMIKPTSYLSRRLEDLYDGLVNTYNVDELPLAELPKTVYTAKDIEEIRALKDKIDASMESSASKPEERFEKARGKYQVEWSEEDEKIKKAISYAIAQSAHADNTLIDGITKDEALAYLDRQDGPVKVELKFRIIRP